MLAAQSNTGRGLPHGKVFRFRSKLQPFLFSKACGLQEGGDRTDKGQVPFVLSPSSREPVLKVLEKSIDVVP